MPRSALLLVCLATALGCGHDWDDYDPRLAGSGAAASSGTAGGTGTTSGTGATGAGGGAGPSSGSTGAAGGASSTGTGGSGGIVVTCPDDGTDQFQDDFEDRTIGAQWEPHFPNPNVQVSESGGSMKFAITASTSELYGGMQSVASYTFSNCSASVRVVDVPTATGYGGLLVWQTGLFANRIEISFFSGDLVFAYFIDDVGTAVSTTPYVQGDHVWWRLREDGGTTRWETSTDGVDYEQRAELPTPVETGSMNVELFGGTHPGNGEVGAIRFDALNTAE